MSYPSYPSLLITQFFGILSSASFIYCNSDWNFKCITVPRRPNDRQKKIMSPKACLKRYDGSHPGQTFGRPYQEQTSNPGFLSPFLWALRLVLEFSAPSTRSFPINRRIQSLQSRMLIIVPLSSNEVKERRTHTQPFVSPFPFEWVLLPTRCIVS